ncbi:MAG: sodium-translocating pyrophosphatase [SAR202 cluster bacterium]|nr:sodium-translocating pyrophosphatase [SAR202 cluster bacterium]
MEGIALSGGAGALALLFALGLVYQVMKADKGDSTMQEIAKAIQEGSQAFLKREYSFLAIFVIVVTVVLVVVIDWRTATAYVVGAIVSAGAGYLGMAVATRANVRTTAAAAKGLNPALRVAFSSGAVMGLMVVGLGLIGVSSLYIIFGEIVASDSATVAVNARDIMEWIVGFSFGASSIALFARVAGGIYTKAADVGADLVGKVEQGIPEDDPRNPAVIADNVGDNVGDVAGMGADLFESYIGSIIAAMALAVFSAGAVGGKIPALTDLYSPFIMFPMLIAAGGIVSSIIGTFFVRANENATFSTLLWALRRGVLVAGVLVVGFTFAITQLLDFPGDTGMELFYCVLIGLGAGIIIGYMTEYYTSYDYGPTKNVAENSETGAATVIIAGFANAMQSTLVPVIVVSAGIWMSFELFGFYGVAIAAVGMLSTLGITLATDAYGPVADNAGGIAEMAHLPAEVRERTDALDSLGNTTAATGKGFAIGSAALTSLALMAAYAQVVGLETADLLDANTMVGLMIGAMLPFLFSSLTMQAVGRAAFAIVVEVRRQFKEIPGLMDGTGRPDYARCVDISTQGALKAMILPGVLAIVTPVVVGMLLGAEALGGMLMGAIASGFMLAVTMANAGGSWDNAKKFIESGAHGGKGSDAHKAAVVGDTVGDPFKDTSGPSLNILLKLMSIVALVFAPSFI